MCMHMLHMSIRVDCIDIGATKNRFPEVMVALAVMVLACGAIYQLVTIRRLSKQAKACGLAEMS